MSRDIGLSLTGPNIKGLPAFLIQYPYLHCPQNHRISLPICSQIMEALFPSALKAPRNSCVESEKQCKNGTAVSLKERLVCLLRVKTMSRRLILRLAGFNSVLLHVNPVFGAPMLDTNEPPAIRTVKLPSGVRIQEIIEGEGPEAHEGDLVEFNYVCRRSNGYFVHSNVDQFNGESSPVVLPLDENRIIEGLKEVLIGMRAGGKRRALIPPSVGYINENLKPIPEEFGPRRSLLSHINEDLIFEVQLLKVV